MNTNSIRLTKDGDTILFELCGTGHKEGWITFYDAKGIAWLPTLYPLSHLLGSIASRIKDGWTVV